YSYRRPNRVSVEPPAVVMPTTSDSGRSPEPSVRAAHSSSPRVFVDDDGHAWISSAITMYGPSPWLRKASADNARYTAFREVLSNAVLHSLTTSNSSGDFYI